MPAPKNDDRWHIHTPGFLGRLLNPVVLPDGSKYVPGVPVYRRRKLNGNWEYRALTAQEFEDHRKIYAQWQSDNA